MELSFRASFEPRSKILASVLASRQSAGDLIHSEYPLLIAQAKLCVHQEERLLVRRALTFSARIVFQVSGNNKKYIYIYI